MVRQIEQEARLPKGTVAKHHGSTRFPLSLDVRYTMLSDRGPFEAGSGTTCDMSSSGLSFTADKPLLVGQTLRVSIDWPALLDGCVRLQLVVHGVVVRAGGAVTALQIDRHEFRTRRVGLKVLQDPVETGGKRPALSAVAHAAPVTASPKQSVTRQAARESNVKWVAENRPSVG